MEVLNLKDFTLFPLSGWGDYPLSQTFLKIWKVTNSCRTCFCDCIQDSKILRSWALAIFLEAPQYFWKYMNLYQSQFFCILAVL